MLNTFLENVLCYERKRTPLFRVLPHESINEKLITYIEYQFPFEVIFEYETFPAITNNITQMQIKNGNILCMEKSVQPFLFVSCYFLLPSNGEGRLKFPRRLAKGKASKQFEAAKCADGTMSPLIESGRDLCISGRGLGRLSFSNLRVHATPVHAGEDERRLCANHLRRRGVEKQQRKSLLLPFTHLCISPKIWKHRPILNGGLTNFY